MKLEITGRHFDVTPSIKSHISHRLKKLPKILDEQAEAHIILSIEKYRHIAEINLKCKLGQITGIEATTDMYASINKALDKIEKRALKFKQKRIASKRIKSPAKFVAASSVAIGEIGSNEHGKAVFRREISKKPMTLEEAMLSLDQSGGNFIVFRDAKSQLVNVLYKLKDGNYGLISPEE